MKFTLQYSGPIYTEMTGPKLHGIRCEMHSQLKNLWALNPFLSEASKAFLVYWDGKVIGRIRQLSETEWAAGNIQELLTKGFPTDTDAALYLSRDLLPFPGFGFLNSLHGSENRKTFEANVKLISEPDEIADRHKVEGFRFLPLATESLFLQCHLSIVVARRTPSGPLSGPGDIDNKLKRFFDALRVPNSKLELGNQQCGAGQDPFYCLLEDDKLISGFDVRTRQLLRPLKENEKPERTLDITVDVTLSPTVVTSDNLGFFGD